MVSACFLLAFVIVYLLNSRTYFFSFGNTDEDDGSSDRTLMYYVNDGVYGSFNCILFDHAHVTPIVHKVWK